MITRSMTESLTKYDQSAHLATRKGVVYTYDEVVSDAGLQSLSYLEEVLNLGTSE